MYTEKHVKNVEKRVQSRSILLTSTMVEKGSQIEVHV